MNYFPGWQQPSQPVQYIPVALPPQIDTEEKAWKLNRRMSKAIAREIAKATGNDPYNMYKKKDEKKTEERKFSFLETMGLFSIFSIVAFVVFKLLKVITITL